MKQLHWILSQSFQSHRVSIPSSLSPTMTVPKCRVLSHAEKRSTQKKLQPYMLSTYSLPMDSPLRSLATETLALLPNPQGNYVTFWASNRTSLWHIIPVLTDSQNRQISGWSNISISGLMSGKTIGLLISQWQNSRTTTG